MTGPVRDVWSTVARWGPIVAVIAVTAAVGGVAAVISYAHQHALNLAHEAAQTEWTARFWPITVEGIVLASGLVLVIRRMAGRPGGLIVWSAMLVGAAVTLAANVASAPLAQATGAPDRTAQLMNAWPPLAFLFAVELLVIAFRPRRIKGQDEALPVPGQVLKDASSQAALPVVQGVGGCCYVYRLVDRDGALLYVGITGTPAARLAEHRSAKPWWSEVDRAEITAYGSRMEALGIERDVIATENPRYNIATGSVLDAHTRGLPDRAVFTGPTEQWSEPGRPQSVVPIADEHFAAVQALADELGARPTRQAVRDLTGVGATRADRLRHAVRVPERGDPPDQGCEEEPA